MVNAQQRKAPYRDTPYLRVLNGNKPRIQYDFATPYSEEAEEAVLGAIMINPDVFRVIRGFLSPDDFFLMRHGYVFRAMERLIERGDPIDYLTVINELRSVGVLDEIGGIPSVTRLVNCTPTSVHGEFYGRIVQRCGVRRQILVAADEMKALAINEILDLEQVISESEARMRQVFSKGLAYTERTALESMHALIDDIDARRKSGDTGYIPTGLSNIDTEISILRRGSVTICAGRPGMGKSALILSIMRASCGLGNRWAHISCEAGINDNSTRLASIDSGINVTQIAKARFTDREYDLFIESAGRLAKLPYVLDWRPGMTMLELRGVFRRIHDQMGVDVLAVDGLWEMQMPDESDRKKINDRIVSELAELAKEHNISVFLAHQLNRNCDYRKDHRPHTGDLEYGGEQSADIIILPYRDIVYNPDTDSPNQADLIVDKNKHGPTGTIPLYFDGTCARFMEGMMRRVDVGDQ